MAPLETPMVELTNLEKKYNLKAKIIAKVERFNPGGSVKDRIAKAMIEKAEKYDQSNYPLFNNWSRNL